MIFICSLEQTFDRNEELLSKITHWNIPVRIALRHSYCLNAVVVVSCKCLNGLNAFVTAISGQVEETEACNSPACFYHLNMAKPKAFPQVVPDLYLSAARELA